MTKWIMAGSAALFVSLGAALLFFPGELVSKWGLDASAQFPVQLLAGGLFAIAGLNWMGRSAIYGAIFGRPVIIANLYFGLLTTTTLLSARFNDQAGSWVWLLIVAFGLHAVLFGWMLYSPPRPASAA